MATILLCDDAMFMRSSIKQIVQKAGHLVVAEAANGKECIELYSLLSPDFILMDITMPDMDGITATKAIMEINPNAKIIMVSALGQQEKVFEAIASGAKDFIVKPFKPEKIIQCIEKYL